MSSDPIAYLALWVGIVLAAASLTLLVVAIGIRIGMSRGREQVAAAQARWFPHFITYAGGKTPTVTPHVPNRDTAVAVLTLWIDLKETLSGQSSANLVQALRSTPELVRYVPSLIKSFDPRERMLGIVVSGHLEAKEQSPRLSSLMKGGTTESLLAARALAQIDPVANVELVAKSAVSRADWPLPSAYNALQELDRGLTISLLSTTSDTLIREANWPLSDRCVYFLGALGSPSLSQQITALEIAGAPANSLASALKTMSLRPSADWQLVRSLAKHPSEVVRAEALFLMGRSADKEDEPILIQALEDESSRVRTIAAQALARRSDVDAAEFNRIRARLGPKAQDLLAQAAAEEVSSAAALESIIDDPSSSNLRSMRAFFKHPNWRIRLRAVESLGLADSAASQKQLSEFLTSDGWWVRYNAARNLLDQTYIDASSLKRLLSLTSDDRSRAILARVAAEHPRFPA